MLLRGEQVSSFPTLCQHFHCDDEEEPDSFFDAPRIKKKYRVRDPKPIFITSRQKILFKIEKIR